MDSNRDGRPGPYVLEALKSGSMSATCLTGPSVTSVSFGSGGGTSSTARTVGGEDPGGSPRQRTTPPARV